MSTESTMQAALQASPEPEAGQIRRGDTLVPEDGDGSCWADGCDSLNGNGKRPLEEDSKEKKMADIAFYHGRNEVLRNMRDGLENGTVKDARTEASIQSLTDDIAHNERRIAQLEDALQQEDALWEEKCRKIDEKEKKDVQDLQDRLLTPCTDEALRERFLDVLKDGALVEFVLANAESDPIVQQTLQAIRDNDLELVRSVWFRAEEAHRQATDAWLQADEAGDKAEATRLEELQEQANGLECVADAAYRTISGGDD